MTSKTTVLGIFLFVAFSACQLIAGGEEQPAKRVLTEQQTLAIFKLVLKNFEKTGVVAVSEKVPPILDMGEAQKVFERYWQKSGKNATLPTGSPATWEEVREHDGYFFRVFKDEGLNCTIVFCKKGGDTIYLANFGPRYT